MFDPDDGRIPHCDPVSDTKELTKLFYSMTEEIWKDLNFGDSTYLNVYMQRSQFNEQRDIS